MMARICERAIEYRKPVAIYTHRRTLLTQTHEYLQDHGIDVGIRAAGHKPALLRDVQICMVPSEHNAVMKKKRRDLHNAKIVLIDEAHNNAADSMTELRDSHLASGANIAGFTATPIGLMGEYDELIQAGTMSGLRECGALVMSRTYAPDKPDLSKLKPLTREYSEKEQRQVLNPAVIIGRVLENYKRLNTEGHPSLLFAGGVAEAIYFAEQFHKAGISAAAVGNDQIWMNGDWMELNDDTRQMLRDGSRAGNPEIICNRFIYREGVDYPWLRFGILACIFGSLQSYVQAGGRLGRAHEGKDFATIIDHGGNWHRHGSLNEDRDWYLEGTELELQGVRREKLRNQTIAEPVTCWKCGCVSYCYKGPCPACGVWIHTRRRVVIQTDGKLLEKTGRIYRKKPRTLHPNTEALWSSIYWRFSKTEKTFNQAEGFFVHIHGYRPPRDLPLMPREADGIDWFRRVRDVERGNLL